MRTLLILIASLMLFAAGGNGLHAAVPEEDVVSTLIQVPVSGPEDVEKLIELGLQIELNIVRNEVAEGFISKKNLERVRNAGFSVTEVPDVCKKEGSLSRKPWYSFEDIRELLTEWEKAHPEIAKFDTAGYSITGKPIFQFKISGSPDTAARQRFYFSGSTHGNEWIGTETCMRIMQHLLESYESRPNVRSIVDRSDFVFHPILNVDGFMSGSKGRRTLDNGCDPNRAFGWKVGGKSSDKSLPCQWPEMKTHLYPMIEAPYYFSVDYHCGFTGLLDPFFAPVSGGVMDADAYKELAKYYPLGEVGRWEEVYILETRGGGISCDGPYGKCGTMAFLPELCDHYPAESKIDGLTEFNLECVLDVINEMQKGVCGRITDARDGSPVYGRIQVESNGAAVFSDPRSGAFYKYIPSPSGSFDVTVFANGYKPETKTVSANADTFAVVDFPLEYDPKLKYAALSTDILGLDNEISQQEIYACLQSPDTEGTKIDGFIIVDFGASTPVTDQDGADDLTVHGISGNYTVSVHYDIDKIIDDEGIKLGEGQGVQSFDLSSADIDSARWVRIDGSATIDAIEAAPRDIPTAVNSISVKSWKNEKPKVVSYIPTSGVVVRAMIPAGDYSIIVYDMKGKRIRNISQGIAKTSSSQLFQWDGCDINNSKCAAGTYLFHINVSNGKYTLKIPVLQ